MLIFETVIAKIYIRHDNRWPEVFWQREHFGDSFRNKSGLGRLQTASVSESV